MTKRVQQNYLTGIGITIESLDSLDFTGELTLNEHDKKAIANYIEWLEGEVVRLHDLNFKLNNDE